MFIFLRAYAPYAVDVLIGVRIKIFLINYNISANPFQNRSKMNLLLSRRNVRFKTNLVLTSVRKSYNRELSNRFSLLFQLSVTFSEFHFTGRSDCIVSPAQIIKPISQAECNYFCVSMWRVLMCNLFQTFVSICCTFF